MNHITVRNRAQSQLLAYMDFLPYCTTWEDRMKLLDEIQKLSDFVKKVDDMPTGLAKAKVINYWLVIESDINN